jgi:hypothetical protein
MVFLFVEEVREVEQLLESRLTLALWEDHFGGEHVVGCEVTILLNYIDVNIMQIYHTIIPCFESLGGPSNESLVLVC